MSEEYIYVPTGGASESKGGGINMNLVLALLIVLAVGGVVFYVSSTYKAKKRAVYGNKGGKGQ
uniref:Uncharacterized protein n=1 Tax=viral metagenome TaxID=1070528 RepID=A0A6C0M2J2_9ZZZZ